ncbi:MAG: outer membrane protein assembly factor BamE [Halioglobus sp.]
MNKSALKILVPLLLAVLAGCAQYENKRGVEVAWQPEAMSNLSKGVTTRQQVLELLGPPSQVISLQDETVLYYLFEQSDGEALILIVYNTISMDTQYDRAIFFFDENDVLSDYASRIETP